jgi:hypothetical protein
MASCGTGVRCGSLAVPPCRRGYVLSTDPGRLAGVGSSTLVFVAVVLAGGVWLLGQVQERRIGRDPGRTRAASVPPRVA